MSGVVALLIGLALAAAPWPDGAHLDYQLGGASSPDPGVGIVVRDRTEDPVAGLYNVCYINGFQTQPDQKRFWRERWRFVLKDDEGRAVEDAQWGEWLLDTSRRRPALAAIVGRWTDRCAARGYDAVEFDNLDSWSRSDGLLGKRDNKRFARLLIRHAHDAGLAVAQKNWAGLDGTRLGFDLAIAEECGRYDECDRYVASYGELVLVVEYRRRDFRAACSAYADLLPIVLRDRDLTPDGTRRYC